ncbi:hypothetical protein N9P45_00940 [bacterium]|nr:hypothetical protein [bacterium]
MVKFEVGTVDDNVSPMRREREIVVYEEAVVLWVPQPVVLVVLPRDHRVSDQMGASLMIVHIDHERGLHGIQIVAECLECCVPAVRGVKVISDDNEQVARGCSCSCVPVANGGYPPGHFAPDDASGYLFTAHRDLIVSVTRE